MSRPGEHTHQLAEGTRAVCAGCVLWSILVHRRSSAQTIHVSIGSGYAQLPLCTSECSYAGAIFASSNNREVDVIRQEKSVVLVEVVMRTISILPHMRQI
jgi:hypothetical protein